MNQPVDNVKNPRRPLVLFVAMVHSVHAARWLNLVHESGACDLLVYPSLYMPAHGDLHPEIRVAYPRWLGGGTTGRTRWHWPRRVIDLMLARMKGYPRGAQFQSPKVLARLIQQSKPDLLHALELQHAGYLAMQALDALPAGQQVPLALSNWGSDIFWYQHEERHRWLLQRLLGKAQYYMAECARDYPLARTLGFGGKEWPVMPSGGGMDLALLGTIAQAAAAPSQRRRIVIKGYQHFVGRALQAAAALEACGKALEGFELVVFSPAPVVRRAIEKLARRRGLAYRFVSGMSHVAMLELFASARVYIGISASDGISTSALEAMAMGCFPIQSNTACCDEWFEAGVGGFAPPPENVEAIAKAIRDALNNDALVDRAAIINRATIEMRADRRRYTQQVARCYGELTAPPAITIITPTHNRARLLKQTMQSVLSAGYERLQYVIVDDASSDETPQVVAEMAARYPGRVHYLRQPVNAGESAAINAGLAASNGELIATLSDDDLLLPEWFEVVPAVMRRHPQLVAAYPDWHVIDENGQQLRTVKMAQYDFKTLFASHHSAPGAGVVIRASAISRDEPLRSSRYRYAPDYLMWLTLALRGPMARIPEPLACWREHGHSITVAATHPAKSMEMIALAEAFVARHKEHPLVRRHGRKLRCRAYLHACQLALRCRDWPRALRWLASAVCCHAPWAMFLAGSYVLNRVHRGRFVTSR